MQNSNFSFEWFYENTKSHSYFVVTISGEKKRNGHTRLEVYVALSHRILSDYKTILILRGVNAFVDFETFCCYWSLYHRKAFQQQRDATLEWNVHCELWYSYSSTTGLNFDVSFLFIFSNLNLRSSELSLSTFLSELCNTLF